MVTEPQSAMDLPCKPVTLIGASILPAVDAKTSQSRIQGPYLAFLALMVPGSLTIQRAFVKAVVGMRPPRLAQGQPQWQLASLPCGCHDLPVASSLRSSAT